MPELLDAVIVGGGISGLSAAWHLQTGAARAGLHCRYALLESSARLGGHIVTERVPLDGHGTFVVEGGPDSFMTQKPWAMELARELGLGDRLLGTNDHLRKTYVLNRGKPTPLPDGVLLIVPTRFAPFAFSSLISPWGKLRMGLDLVIPPRRDGGDETLAEFVRRRLGREALDKIAEPLMSGIYNSEAERQSVMATFPRFRALEARYGSLTRGMLASRRATSAPHAPSAPKLPMFMSLRGGMAELPETLAAHLSGDVRLSTPVARIARADAGTYAVTSAAGETFYARALVLATPAFVTAELLRELAPAAADALRAVRYVSTGTLSLGYRLGDLTRPLRGFGLVVPRSEKRPLNAVTWSSVKFDHRAPDGYALLRVFFGGSRSPQSMALDDEALLAVVRDALRDWMGIQNAPLFHRIYRRARSNAQYDVGHLDRLTALEAQLPPRLWLTGSPYRGVGVPDCVKQGQDTALQVISTLKGSAV